jgi:hypothetical protein
VGKLQGIFSDIEERPVSINKATIDLLLKQDEPHGLIGLYSFYYYTAIWQKTNQPKSSTGYSAKGLKISKARIRRYKSKLIELGLIEEIVRRTEDNTKIKGHFIKVKYYKCYPTHSLQGSKSKRVEKREGNTYSDSRLNTYRDNSVTCKHDDPLFKKKKDVFSVYHKWSIRLLKIVSTKRKLMRRPAIKNWDIYFKMLHTKDGVKKNTIRKALTWYKNNIGGEYVPDIRSGKSFRDKFDKLVAAMERDEKLAEKGEKTIIYKVKRRKAKKKC